MTSKDLKIEIQKALDNVPNSALKDILDYLKTISKHPEGKIRLSNNFKKILSEDRDLLEKLAE